MVVVLIQLACLGSWMSMDVCQSVCPCACLLACSFISTTTYLIRLFVLWSACWIWRWESYSFCCSHIIILCCGESSALMLIQRILTSYLGMSPRKRHHLHLGEQNTLSELLDINTHLPSQYQSYCAFDYQSFVVPATRSTSPCVPATQNTSPFVSPDLDQSSCQDK